MMMRRVWLLGWLSVAVGWGYLVSALTPATGWYVVIAPASVVVLVALFAWTRRGLEIVDVVMPSLAQSYFGYVGIALHRASHTRAALPTAALRREFGPFGDLGLLTDKWPLVLAGGLIFAAIITVLAVPLSMVPSLFRKPVPHRDEDLWKFVERRNQDRDLPR